MAKISKASVKYRPAAQRTNGGRKCGNCVMLIPGVLNHCTLVAGIIDKGYVCGRWKGKKT